MMAFSFSVVRLVLLAAFLVCLLPWQGLSCDEIGNGVNLQASYFNNGNVTFCWKLMQSKSKIKSVRIEIEPFKVKIDLVAKWIREAVAHGFQVIATCHIVEALGNTDYNSLNQCAQWWKKNYRLLRDDGGHFKLNLINEWGDKSISASEFALAYKNALDAVREGGYKDTVIIDAPGFGQVPQTIRDALPLLKGHGHILPSLHVYPCSWNEAKKSWLTKEDLDSIQNAIIGEFGSHAHGDCKCDWRAVVRRAKEKKWTVMAWAWNGDGTPLAEGGAMNMMKPYWGDEPQFSESKCATDGYGYFEEMYNEL